jgi:hypothetical protein
MSARPWDEQEDWESPLANAHSAQIYRNRPHMDYETDGDFWRILRENAPEREYRSREEIVKTVCHWGQRKLLLSEIEFFTLIGPNRLRNALVVYAGAASGKHIVYLSALFPSVRFVLIDPSAFARSVRACPRVRIINDLMTDDLARELSRESDNLYFISDIRSDDPNTSTREENERCIREDMDAQARWHGILGSKRSMLKFRLPWADGQTRYLNGDIYLPVWGPQSTTEARLITTDVAGAERYRLYDNRKYERQMFYFNNFTRHSLYRHGVASTDASVEGLDHCYDCKAEIEILRRYLTEVNPRMVRADGVEATIARMIVDISFSLDARRHLRDGNPNSEERYQQLHRRRTGLAGEFFGAGAFDRCLCAECVSH